jgi:hypothetical protein
MQEVDSLPTSTKIENEECLLCKAPLKYLVRDKLMECSVCRKIEMSKTRCVNGHYVCDECHSKGMEIIIPICLAQKHKNPIMILEKLMDAPFCHMHGPEHHVLVGASLLTAYANSGGEINLQESLDSVYTSYAKILSQIAMQRI